MLLLWWIPLSLGLAGMGQPASDDSLPLSLEDIFHPERGLQIEDSRLADFEWSRNRRDILFKKEGSRWLEIEARSGETRSLLTSAELRRAFQEQQGLQGQDLERTFSMTEAVLSPEEDAVLIEWEEALFLYLLEEDRLVSLVEKSYEAEVPAFDPAGEQLAFVSKNDLYVISVTGGVIRRLTHTGGPELFNGKLDFVYQEELYGRGNFQGYWWSPAGDKIAFLQLDEKSVPRYILVDEQKIRGATTEYHYPKAGDPNPRVRLGVLDLETGEVVWASLFEEGTGRDHLISRVSWHPSGKRLYVQVQNREQTWLELREMEIGNPSTRVVLREVSPAWVDVLGDPLWYENGDRFLWLSERSGFSQLYSVEAVGGKLSRLTKGSWTIKEIVGLDEEWGEVYLTAAYPHPRELQLLAVSLGDGEARRVTRSRGEHEVSANRDRTLFLDRWSSLEDPGAIRLLDREGEIVRGVSNAVVPLWQKLEKGEVGFLEIPARDGYPLDAILLKPPDFDPRQRYPVVCRVYGGPESPLVRDVWKGRSFLWYQHLAQRGFLVWIQDNRASTRRGTRAAWAIHRQLGSIEVQDLEDGVHWLASRSFVDAERIGIWGSSYGGYLAALALVKTDLFRSGIALSPVTDWHLYDTIYTERYLGLPEENPSGYHDSSVLHAAQNLESDLLLLHGTMDDNVHFQHTSQLVRRLQEEEKDFQLMIFPGARHSIVDPEQRYDLYRRMTRFLEATLGNR